MAPRPALGLALGVAALGHAAWSLALLPDLGSSTFVLGLSAVAFALVAAAAWAGWRTGPWVLAATLVYAAVTVDQALVATGAGAFWGSFSFALTLAGLALWALAVPRGWLPPRAALAVAALGPLAWTVFDVLRGVDAYHAGNALGVLGLGAAAWLAGDAGEGASPRRRATVP